MKKRKRPLILDITIISYVLLFLFRLFNPPYMFGKVVEGSFRYVLQAGSLVLLGIIIYGLYRMRFWGFVVYLVMAMIGLANHLYVIALFFTDQGAIPANLISANPLLNSVVSWLYPLLTVFWAGAALYLFNKKDIFEKKL